MGMDRWWEANDPHRLNAVIKALQEENKRLREEIRLLCSDCGHFGDPCLSHRWDEPS